MSLFKESVINNILISHDNNDWFDLSDIVFTQFIMNETILDEEALLGVKKVILSSADQKGFFHPNQSKKSHNKYHSTAYALSTLKLISALTNTKYDVNGLLTKVLQYIKSSEAMPDNFSLLDKLHVWRASHTFGGISAIYELAIESGLKDKNDVLDFYTGTVNQKGVWLFAGNALQTVFDILYSIRHNPRYARYGGAAHLYWHMKEIPENISVNEAVDEIINFYKNHKGILEKTPYCLDYDVLYILRFIIRSNKISKDRIQKAQDVFYTAGMAILRYLENNESMWTHAYPGALAALEVCSVNSDLSSELTRKKINLKDVMEYTVWL